MGEVGANIFYLAVSGDPEHLNHNAGVVGCPGNVHTLSLPLGDLPDELLQRKGLTFPGLLLLQVVSQLIGQLGSKLRGLIGGKSLARVSNTARVAPFASSVASV